MPRLNLKPKSLSEIDHRKAVLSLRWLLLILASYLTVFSYAGSYGLPVVFGIAVAFAVSNIGLMIIPSQRFVEDNVQRAIAVFDVLFIAAILYVLRVPDNYLYIAFIGIIILALIWRDFRLVLFSLLVVTVLFAAFTYFRLFGF